MFSGCDILNTSFSGINKLKIDTSLKPSSQNIYVYDCGDIMDLSRYFYVLGMKVDKAEYDGGLLWFVYFNNKISLDLYIALEPIINDICDLMNNTIYSDQIKIFDKINSRFDGLVCYFKKYLHKSGNIKCLSVMGNNSLKF